MTGSIIKFQPGVALYDVVLGSFRTGGTTFEVWCRSECVIVSAARNALKGVNSGPAGKEIVGRLIKATDEEIVALACRKRLERHVSSMSPRPAGSEEMA